MSTINNQPPIPGAITPGRPLTGAAPAAPAAVEMAGDQVAMGASPQELAQLRMILKTGGSIDVTNAVFRLEALAGGNRQHVVEALLEHAETAMDLPSRLAAISALQRLRATEAVDNLRSLAFSGEAGISTAARSAMDAIQPPAQPPAGPPGAAPAGPAGAPAAQAAPAGHLPPNVLADLTARLLHPQQAPQAALDLDKLPTPQILEVTGRLLRDFQLPPGTMALLTRILAKRLREPGAADQLRMVVRQDPNTHVQPVSSAALALAATRDPAYMKDVLYFLAQRSTQLMPIKRAIVDSLAKDPQRLAHPAVPIVFGAMLHEERDPALRSAVSHALSKVRSPQARDALAKSPLLRSGEVPLIMRGLWDLGAHPAPYPPEAVNVLKNLAQHPDPQVKQQAEALLKKRG